MAKQNCWEFMRCERQPKGRLVGDLGECPASTDRTFHSVHGGVNGGRACWAIAGTFCGGAIQGSEAQKQHTCWKCEFFQHVRREESDEPLGFSATMLGMRSVLARR